MLSCTQTTEFYIFLKIIKTKKRWKLLAVCPKKSAADWILDHLLSFYVKNHKQFKSTEIWLEMLLASTEHFMGESQMLIGNLFLKYWTGKVISLSDSCTSTQFFRFFPIHCHALKIIIMHLMTSITLVLDNKDIMHEVHHNIVCKWDVITVILWWMKKIVWVDHQHVFRASSSIVGYLPHNL